MLSKNKLKVVNSLQINKFRDELGLFVAEGTKLVVDLSNAGMTIDCLIATPEWLTQNTISAAEVVECSMDEMKKASQLKTPTSVLALVKIPKSSGELVPQPNSLVMALDNIQDPGNLGTIIRLADWFGIQQIVCSVGTVDCFNPKVVQATMGAIARVSVCYCNLGQYLKEARQMGIAVYGTFLEGEPIYSQQLSAAGIIVLGNEGKGISPDVEQYINDKLLIPDFSVNATKPESLNVSVAAAIVCSEFKRRGLPSQV